ncbi:hypothetical protein ABK040_011236 [Willaertia magna]
MFEIQVTHHEVVTNDSYVLFCLTISTDEPNQTTTTWHIEKRYSHLRKLHLELANYYFNLPDFPPKYWKDNLKEEKILERKNLLNTYYKNLTKRSDIFTKSQIPAFFLNFMNTPKNVYLHFANENLILKKSTEKFLLETNTISINNNSSNLGNSGNTQNNSLQNSLQNISTLPLMEWGIDEVSLFLNKNLNLPKQVIEMFKKEQIDGSALLYITKKDILKMLQKYHLENITNTQFNLLLTNLEKLKELQRDQHIDDDLNLENSEMSHDNTLNIPVDNTFDTTNNNALTTTTTTTMEEYDDEEVNFKQDMLQNDYNNSDNNNTHNIVTNQFTSTTSIASTTSKSNLTLNNKICPEFDFTTELTTIEKESYRYCLQKIDKLKEPVPDTIKKRLCQDLVIPQRFKFKYLNPNSIPEELRLLNFNKNKNKKDSEFIKIKLIITELGDGFAHRTMRRLGSLVKHQEIKNSEYGLFHSSLIIGFVQLEWTDNSICVCRKDKSSSKAVFAVDVATIKGQENVNDVFDKLSEFCCYWNGHRIYNQKDANCQHFVVDLLKCIGVYNHFKKKIENTLLGNYLNKLKEYGTCDMTFPLNDQIKTLLLNANEKQEIHLSNELKTILKTNQKEIQFLSHEMLDEFYRRILTCNPTYFESLDAKREEELLKAYDRAFWLRYQSVKMQKDGRVCPHKEGCPFDRGLDGNNTVKGGFFYLGDYTAEYPVPTPFLNK